MKIKFDFGTQRDIPNEIIQLGIIEAMKIPEAFKLNAGKCAIYLTFYNRDGLETTVVKADTKQEINYLIRAQKYQRIPKNTEYIGKCSVNPEAHLYKQYTD